MFILFAVIGVAIIYGIYYISGLTGSAVKSDGSEELARCLTENGAKLYGASWCPHCQNQKALFGEAGQYLPYIECTEKPEECRAASITAYPTWIINGEKYMGEKSLEELKSLSGC